MNPSKRRSFLSLLFVTAVDNFGFGLVFVMFAPLLLNPTYPFLPEATSITMRNFYLGALFAAYPLTQFFGAPILGDYADWVGRKKALSITIYGVIAGFLLSGVACLLYSFPFLFFSRLFTGFFAGNLSICLSAIAGLSETEKLRSRNFGLVTVAWGVSWNIAMLVGGYLSDPTKSRFFNPALPFWITAALTLLSLVAIIKYYEETKTPQENTRFNLTKGLQNIHLALKVKQLRPYFLLILIWTLGWGIAVQWFGTFSFLKFQISQQAVSWGLLIQGVFWMIGGSLMNPLLLKRYASFSIALIAFSSTTLFLFLTLLPHQYLFFCLLFWTAAIFSSLAISNSMNLASIHAPEHIQGKIMGLSQSMMSLGWVIVPLMGGYLGGINVQLFYLIGAIMVFLGVAVLLYHKRQIHKS